MTKTGILTILSIGLIITGGLGIGGYIAGEQAGRQAAGRELLQLANVESFDADYIIPDDLDYGGEIATGRCFTAKGDEALAGYYTR